MLDFLRMYIQKNYAHFFSSYLLLVYNEERKILQIAAFIYMHARTASSRRR